MTRMPMPSDLAVRGAANLAVLGGQRSIALIDNASFGQDAPRSFAVSKAHAAISFIQLLELMMIRVLVKGRTSSQYS